MDAMLREEGESSDLDVVNGIDGRENSSACLGTCVRIVVVKLIKCVGLVDNALVHHHPCTVIPHSNTQRTTPIATSPASPSAGALYSMSTAWQCM